MRHAHLTLASRLSPLLLLVLAAACGGAPPPAAPSHPIAETPKNKPDPASSDEAACKNADVPAFLARHAVAFGSEADTKKALPVTLSGKAELRSKGGTYAMSLDDVRSRSVLDIPGLSLAGGVDEQGPWQVGASGSLLRLKPDEALDATEWVLRRRYLSAWSPGRDTATCELGESGPRLVVHENVAEAGNPVLTFDWKTGALEKITHTGLAGAASTMQLQWSARAGASPAWPTAFEEHGPGSTMHVTIDKVGPAATDAFTPWQGKLAFTFPASGVVRVPMRLYANEIFMKAKIGGADVTALLDSGAGISVVEASGKASAGFKPELELQGASATQAISFAIGTVPDASVGALSLENLPAARVPIPAFDQAGPNRPDVVLGWSFFESLGVRVDYAKNEIAFAKTADALHSAKAVKVPFRDLEDKVVVQAKIGEAGKEVDTPIQVDTGNASGVSLASSWAQAHAFPGDRPNVSLMGQFSAGHDVTSSWFFRTPFSVGPLHAEKDLVEVFESPAPAAIAGLLGNEALAKCDAVTFDMANRTVWIEGSCTRTVPISHSWWTLLNDGAADPRHPWVIGSTAAKGSADVAGIARGDRLLSIAGKDVGPHFDFVAALQKPLGAKIPVVVQRGGGKKSVTMLLADPI